MPVLFSYDFKDLVKLNTSLNNVLTSLPSAKRTLLRNIVSRYRSVIQDQILTQNIRYTGTYEKSIKVLSGGSEQEPTMSIVMDPTGSGANRLPIYWKVLEFGAGPSPNVLSPPILVWADQKLGTDITGGFRIANRIRSRGINPHPILSSIFILNPPDGGVSGLTPLAESISEQESQKVMDRFVKSWESQPRIPKGVPEGGQFTFRN